MPHSQLILALISTLEQGLTVYPKARTAKAIPQTPYITAHQFPLELLLRTPTSNVAMKRMLAAATCAEVDCNLP